MIASLKLHCINNNTAHYDKHGGFTLNKQEDES